MKLLFVRFFYTLQVSNYPFTNMLCVHKSFNREGTMWLAKKPSIGEQCCREHLFSRYKEGMWTEEVSFRVPQMPV